MSWLSMARVLFFVKKPEMREYHIQGTRLEIEVNEHIFPPSPHGLFLAENMKIKKGETVIDVGTGSGILAILAAKLGGKVSATDTDIDAIETAKRNAARNDVIINFQRGEYFANFNRKFDVIIANLPQEIVHENYKKAIGRQLTESFDGEPDGNMHVLEFLDIAKKYMHERSRIYVIVYTVSDYAKTINSIVSKYNAHLVSFDSCPTKEFVEDNIDFYLKLNEIGKIKIFRAGKKWMAYEYIFELNLK